MTDDVRNDDRSNDSTVPALDAETTAAAPVREAMKARAPKLDVGMTCGEALQLSLATASQQILWNWDLAVSGGDEEAVHQWRVALRRLRVALRVLRADRVEDSWRHVAEDAKALIAVTGETRDLDVVACDVVAPLSSVVERPDFSGLIALLDQARVQSRTRLRANVGEARWVAFRARLALLPIEIEQRDAGGDVEALSRSARKAGDKELRRLWKRIDEAGAHVDTLDVEQRHDLRKDLRRLRYAVDLMAPLHAGQDSGRQVTEIRRLQHSLGHLNDVAMARKLIDMPAVRDSGDSEVLRAVGFILGWHASKGEDFWRETIGALARLRKSAPFWE